MSWKASAFVKELTHDESGKKLTPAEKCILYTLADYYDEGRGQAWPQLSQLARESLVSERQCSRLICGLEQRGILSVKRDPNASNVYRFITYTTWIPKATKEHQQNQEAGRHIVHPGQGGTTSSAERVDTQGESGRHSCVHPNKEEPSLEPSVTKTNTHGSPSDSVSEGVVGKAKQLEAVQFLFGHYLKRLNRDGKTYTLTEKRRAKGLLRLRECLAKTDNELKPAVRLMMTAIERLAASEFHRSNGFIEWEEHLFRSQEKLEAWLNRKTRAPGGLDDDQLGENPAVKARRQEGRA